MYEVIIKNLTKHHAESIKEKYSKLGNFDVIIDSMKLKGKETKIYCVIDKYGKNEGVYHDTINGAIFYFMMNGEKGAYVGPVLKDWNNFKNDGARVQEYDIE